MRTIINSFSHGQKNGYVIVNVTAANSTYMNFQADLLRPSSNPTWVAEVYKWSLSRGPTLLFNVSIRACEMQRFATRNPFTNALREFTRDLTNFSFTCPLEANRYFVNLDRFYEQVPKGNNTLLAEVALNFIVKSYC